MEWIYNLVCYKWKYAKKKTYNTYYFRALIMIVLWAFHVYKKKKFESNISDLRQNKKVLIDSFFATNLPAFIYF